MERIVRVFRPDGKKLTFDLLGYFTFRGGPWYIGDVGYLRKAKLFFHHEMLGTRLRNGIVVDHINRDKLDNRRSNLRVVTQRDNCLNSKKYKKNASSKYKGVSWAAARLKWCAYYNKKGLGRFNTEKEAAQAYNNYVSALSVTAVLNDLD